MQLQNLDTVELAWKDVLLGIQPHPGYYQQHFIYLREFKTTEKKLRKSVQTYISRSIDIDVISTPNECFTFTKFNYFMILGASPPSLWNTITA